MSMFQCVAALSLLNVDLQRSIDTHLYIRLRRNSGMQYSHLLIYYLRFDYIPYFTLHELSATLYLFYKIWYLQLYAF